MLVGVVAFIGHMVNMVARGDSMSPASIFLRNLAKSAIAGLLAAGVWAALGEFRTLDPTTGIAVAAGVAIFGVDTVTDLARKYVDNKLGKDN